MTRTAAGGYLRTQFIILKARFRFYLTGKDRGDDEVAAPHPAAAEMRSQDARP
jgi:hypothetical protein